MEDQGLMNPGRNRPFLDPLDANYWNCFTERSGCRSAGIDGGDPIRSEDVEAWCRIHGLDCAEVVLQTWRVVRRLDARLTELRDEKKASEKPPRTTKTTR